jgi:hypothetical protein
VQTPRSLREREPRELAFVVVATLEGAMIVSRLADDVSLFDAAVDSLLRRGD